MYQYSSSFRKSIVQSSFRDGDATEEAHGAAVASRFIGFGKAHFVHRCHHHHHRTERRQRRSESKKRRTERLNPLSSYSWSRARLVNSSSSSCWCCLFPRPPFLFVCLFVSCGWKVTLFLSHERTVDTSVKKGDSHEFEPQTNNYEQRRSVFFARIKMNISFALLKMFDVLFSGACITLRFIRISPFLSFSSLISSVSIRTVQNSPSFSRTLPPASRSRRLSSPSPRFRKTPPPARSSLETSRTSS